MSQRDVCSKLNFEKTYLSAIENGRQNITLLTCKQIAEALDVDMKELMVSMKPYFRQALNGHRILPLLT